MRGVLNDLLRWLIGCVLLLGGYWSAWRMQRRLARYRGEQARLHRAYRLSDEVAPSVELPDLGPSTDRNIERRAITSGSTGRPKEIAYSRVRIRSARRAYMGAFLRAYVAIRPKRKSFYVLSSLNADDSLTSLMMEEKSSFPPYLSGLQAPYRVQSHPVFEQLEQRFGATAVRVWVLTLSNPGVIYCTNPSTLSTFVEALETDWERCRALLLLEDRKRQELPPALRACRRRLESTGARKRISELAQRESPPTLVELVPALELYSCWDGGYVGVFLEKIQRHLRGSSVRHLPMYSMSTEVVETLPVFRGEDLAFLPIAQGVRYEFLPVGETDDSSSLREAWELEAGQEYTLVVSNAYGLRRYLTEDVFVCKRMVPTVDLPDLRFLRRRGLAWSFTGEKLTGAQVQEALDELRKREAGLRELDWMALAPTTHAGEKAPGYLLLMVGEKDPSLSGVAELMDSLLQALNLEFSSKRKSGRLSPIETQWITLQSFVERAGGERHRDSWETQFKFLPLLPKVWEVSPQGDS